MVKSPLSLYVHIPFCRKKCPYCHFYVTADREDQKDLLLHALIQEFTHHLSKIQAHEIVSIYFGGGTPTLFHPKRIKDLLKHIQDKAPTASPCEITIEANPEDVTLELMEAYKKAGINRVSIGVQSLVDTSLITLGRTHNANKAISAIQTTYAAGLQNISIDLMYELPNQTLQNFQKTLDLLPSLPISHLSLYNLTIEPGTAFFRRNLAFASEQENLQMLEAAISRIEQIGLSRYEISAFAKPGFKSKHNTGYWMGRPFFGLGPSAFSYYEGSRFRNVASLKKYCSALEKKQSPIDFTETLPYPESVHELLAIRLRLHEGASLNQLTVPKQTLSTIHTLQTEGYLVKREHRIFLTEKGRLFYDTVASLII